MEIYAKFSIDRTDGKTESRENVEAELQSELENNIDQFDVEDSTYEVTEVEIDPKARTGAGPAPAEVGAALLRLADAYFEARPVALDFGDEASHEKAESRKRNIEMLGPEETALDNAIFHLLNETSGLINRAKINAAKAKGK